MAKILLLMFFGLLKTIYLGVLNSMFLVSHGLLCMIDGSITMPEVYILDKIKRESKNPNYYH